MVFCAYVGSERVLVRPSTGQVFKAKKGWHVPEAAVVRVGKPFLRWQDVPSAWAGGCPFW